MSQAFVLTISHGAEEAAENILFIPEKLTASRNQLVNGVVIIDQRKLVNVHWERERSPVPAQQGPSKAVEIGRHDAILKTLGHGTRKRRHSGAQIRSHSPRSGDTEGQGQNLFWRPDFAGRQQPASPPSHHRGLPVACRRLHEHSLRWCKNRGALRRIYTTACLNRGPNAIQQVSLAHQHSSPTALRIILL